MKTTFNFNDIKVYRFLVVSAFTLFSILLYLIK